MTDTAALTRMLETTRRYWGMETDWELGKPPYGIAVEAMVRGYVRRGMSDGSWFVFHDCTHPAQNMINPLEAVEAWRITGDNPINQGWLHSYHRQG